MVGTKAKYHHLIPQTYLSAWEHNHGSLYVRYLNDKSRIVEKNKKNIAGITNYYSITAGMPIITKEDSEVIFECLSDLNVYYKGDIITDSLKLNEIYCDFDNWKVYRKDGKVVSKKKLKSKIDSVKIRDIEENWSLKYENDWKCIRDELENLIFESDGGKIRGAHKEYLMKFYTALDWRSFKSNIQFTNVWDRICNETLCLNKIDIPTEERELFILDNASKEFKHYYLLKCYREYLNDKGLIYNHVMDNLENTKIHFLVSDGTETFNTSDNPAFVVQKRNGTLQRMLSLTPNILMTQEKCANQETYFYVTYITNEVVEKINLEIEKNASEFIIQLNDKMNKS